VAAIAPHKATATAVDGWPARPAPGGDQGQQGGAHAQYRVPGDAIGQVGGLAVAGKRQHADAVAGGSCLIEGARDAPEGYDSDGTRP
jgi:hypothetical protein